MSLFLPKLHTLAQRHQCRLIECSSYHLQIKDGSRILTNLWLSKLKKKDWWPVNKPTEQFRSPVALFAAVEALLIRYRQQRSNAPVPVKSVIIDAFQDRPEIDDVIYGPPKPTAALRRIATCDISLDGRELRVIVNSAMHSESFRLTEQDTLVFLTKASDALSEIQKDQI